ncbi:MAG: flagellar biosynthesis protein FlhF [Gallionella sp.]|jgi:flagellar biosynthesis protein FlhF
MNIRKFVAPTAREALKEIRSELGEDAIILSNRKTELGVQIVAMANDVMERLSESGCQEKRPVHKHYKSMKRGAIKPIIIRHSIRKEAAVVRVPAEVVCTQAPYTSILATEASILGEIKSMHSRLQKQIETLVWNNNVQQRTLQRAGLFRRMLNAGSSLLHARQLLDKMPSGNEGGESWIKQVLKRNLQVKGKAGDIISKGGVYALIGPTGVGKTTTAAKLAARAVERYGADKVALLTTDNYRISGYEQLNIFGKILRVPVHSVRGIDDLRLTLSALRHKHLVLIDTVGMGQRDERVKDQNEMFDVVGVQCLLFLNASSGGDTLDEVVRMFRSKQLIGCIATKLDEAVDSSTVLDIVARHGLVMHYMTNGPRVPEDLHLVTDRSEK